MTKKERKRRLWALMENYGFWYPRKMKEWDKEKANEFFREMMKLAGGECYKKDVIQ